MDELWAGNMRIVLKHKEWKGCYFQTWLLKWQLVHPLWMLWRTLMGLLKWGTWSLGRRYLLGKFRIQLSVLHSGLFTSKINCVWFLGEVLHLSWFTKVTASNVNIIHSTAGCKAPAYVAGALCLHLLTFLVSWLPFQAGPLYMMVKKVVAAKSSIHKISDPKWRGNYLF